MLPKLALKDEVVGKDLYNGGIEERVAEQRENSRARVFDENFKGSSSL